MGFLIATVILVCALQLPFFITGLSGNASMTVALNGIADEVLDIYPSMKDLFNDILDDLASFNLEKLEELMESIANITDSEETDESVRKRNVVYDGYVNMKQALKESKATKASNVKTAIKREDENYPDFEAEDPMAEIREMVKDITDVTDTVMDVIEMIIDILIIVREVIFDIILIMPLIGGILMIVGAFLRIHQLSVSFFPCAFFFSYISIAFVAYEYPSSTLIADGCVIIYNVLEGVDDTEPTQIRSFDDISKIFNSTETIVNEALKVFVDCEKSILGDIKGTINAVLDELISSALGGLNFTYFDGLLNVCNEENMPGIFYNRDDMRNACDDGNTACVYELMQKTLKDNVTYKVDPLVQCGETTDYSENSINIITKFIMLFQNLRGMSYVDQNVYWVNQEDFASYGTEKISNGEGSEAIKLEDVMNNLESFAGLIDPELLEQLLNAYANGDITESQIPDEYDNNRKREIVEAIKLSKLKKDVGDKPVYCANLDGIKVDKQGNKKQDSEGGFDGVPEGYIYSTIACTPKKVIKFTDCSEQCPEIISDLIGPFSEILSATEIFDPMIEIINQLFETIDSLADFVGCKTIGGIAEELPPTICETYLEAETTLVTGLIAYGIILWALYIFGLVAIKRFNYANYLPVEKDAKRYYNQGDIELE